MQSVVVLASLLTLCGVRSMPPDACETMEPSHEGTSQPGSPPYEFYLANDTVLSRLSAHFAIKSKNNRKFVGFMVQARNETGLPIGQFDIGCYDIKIISCFGKFANTAVHLDNEPKTEVHMRWLPEKDFEGNVTFFVTVAESRNVFWARYPARHLQVIKK